MGGVVGIVVAAAVGSLLAVMGIFGLVSSQSATPPVVDAPYVTYDG